jgi:hypothetical protein
MRSPKGTEQLQGGLSHEINLLVSTRGTDPIGVEARPYSSSRGELPNLLSPLGILAMSVSAGRALLRSERVGVVRPRALFVARGGGRGLPNS